MKDHKDRPSPDNGCTVTGGEDDRQNGIRYRHLVEAVTDYIYSVTVKSGRAALTRHGAACVTVTGYTAEEMDADPGLWLRMVVEEDRAAVIRHSELVLKGEDPGAIEHRIIRKDGTLCWVRNTPVLQFDGAGVLTAYDGLIQDITERVVAEDALRKSEAQLHAIVSDSPIPKFVIDQEHRVISWNKALEKITGIAALDILGTTDHWKAFYPARRPCLADLLVDRIPEEIPRMYSDNISESGIIEGVWEGMDFFPSIGENGTYFHITAAPIIDGREEVIGAVETLEDISDLIRAQEELKESEERYSALFSNSYSVSLLIDPDTGRIVEANDAAVRYYGYPYDTLVTMGIYDLNRHPREVVIKNLVRAKNEKEKHFLSTHYLADGEKRFVEVYSGPIPVHGKFLFYSIIHDITESRLAIQALRESEERYRTLVDQLPDYVIVHRDGILLYVNPAAASRLGYNAESLPGKNMMQFVAKEHQGLLAQAVKQRMSGIEIPPYEIDIIAGDGARHNVLINGAYINYQGLPASLNVLTDITAIKEAERAIRSANEELEKRVDERTEALSRANEQLTAEIAARARAEQETKRSLEEKVLLLREIHHRVKNNLQIITSLLKLQSRYITDENVLESIRESQSRVRAMALVHERIYRSPTLSGINLKEYLNYLTRQIFQFYNIQQHEIGISVVMDDIMTDIDTLIPMGLIMNELVSNSLKHAFPKNRRGAITIECTTGPEAFRCIYHDDGVGIPPDFDWRNTESLGLRLVNNLVDQLNGTIEKDEGRGTTFIITIPPGKGGEQP